MTPEALERLLAEAIPTGQWGGPRPEPPPRPAREDLTGRTTPEDAAAHYADLDTALSGWHWDDDPRHHRHLHPIPTAEQPMAEATTPPDAPRSAA